VEPAGKIGVLGTGTMGAGIVQLAAQSGHAVIACDSSVEALERAQVSVGEGLLRFAEKSVFTEEEASAHRDRVRWTTNTEELRGSGVVIEAIVEKIGPKKGALSALDALLPPEALLFTNTSSISITELAGATNRPERVCGTHFFTPPPLREAVGGRRASYAPLASFPSSWTATYPASSQTASSSRCSSKPAISWRQKPPPKKT
jgi:3-hydroxybutyryl-CoA dehydrogenase